MALPDMTQGTGQADTSDSYPARMSHSSYASISKPRFPPGLFLFLVAAGPRYIFSLHLPGSQVGTAFGEGPCNRVYLRAYIYCGA